MKIFNRRNALVGWVVLRVARRKVARRFDTLVNGHPRTRRRRLAATLGAGAAAATAVGLYSRRSRTEPARGTA